MIGERQQRIGLGIIGADRAYRDTARWTRMSILNVARSGKFSSDRSIQEYADKIWKVTPVKVPLL